MNRQFAKQFFFFAVVTMLLVASIAIVEFGTCAKWVGRTDLEIRFVVTDTETGQPIPNATIQIREKHKGFCDPPPDTEFTLTTDNNGQAKCLATNCMCFGSRGAFEDTFASHLPYWTFHASTNGFDSSDPADLNEVTNSGQVQRGKPATLSVAIRLRTTSV